jgi:hypothetical protein
MISIPNMRPSLQIALWLALGLVWFVCTHMQRKWLRTAFSCVLWAFYAIALLRKLGARRTTREGRHGL